MDPNTINKIKSDLVGDSNPNTKLSNKNSVSLSDISKAKSKLYVHWQIPFKSGVSSRINQLELSIRTSSTDIRLIDLSCLKPFLSRVTPENIESLYLKSREFKPVLSVGWLDNKALDKLNTDTFVIGLSNYEVVLKRIQPYLAQDKLYADYITDQVKKVSNYKFDMVMETLDIINDCRHVLTSLDIQFIPMSRMNDTLKTELRKAEPKIKDIVRAKSSTDINSAFLRKSSLKLD